MTENQRARRSTLYSPPLLWSKVSSLKFDCIFKQHAHIFTSVRERRKGAPPSTESGAPFRYGLLAFPDVPENVLDRLNSLAPSTVAVNLSCFLFLAKLPAVAVPQVPNFGGGVAGFSVGGHNVYGGNDLPVGIVR